MVNVKTPSTIKNAIAHNWGFWIFAGISIFLLVTGFFLPPLGVIDPSVVKAVGELFGFAALGTLLYGIDKGLDVAFKHNDTEINLNTPDGDRS